MFKLRVLGGALLEGPDGPLTGAVAQRQRLALLALLALAPTGRINRDRLLALLWPEQNQEKARHALSNALYMLRKELGEEALLIQGEELGLNADVVSVDALEFLAALEEERHQAAVELYQGPFLDGIYLKDTPEFEKWLDGERDRFAQALAEAFEALALQAQEEGDTKSAVKWWRKLAGLDPFNTRTALALMKALDAEGSRANAIQHAEIYSTLMREELGAEPDPSVVKLANDLRSGPPHAEGRIGESPVPDRAVDPSNRAPEGQEKPRGKPFAEDTETAERGVSDRGHRPPLARAAESPLFQWSMAYLTGAWLVLQAMDVLSEPWSLSLELQRGATALLLLGFPVAAALGWYRSRSREKGVRGYSVLTAAVILGVFGTGLAFLSGPDSNPDFIQRGILRGSYGGAGSPRSLPSIAVLPLDNISPSQEDAYLANGLHEELITQLSKISGLLVISRGSVMEFRDHRRRIPDIARELNVDAVLEGSIQKVGSQLRITAQLIDGPSDAHIWGESYDRTFSMESLFAVQREISLRIAERLRATLSPDERDRLARLPTQNLEAFDLYLRGKEAYLRYRAEDNQQAMEFFRQALEHDPGFSLAWASLANAYGQGVLGFGLAAAWADSAVVAAEESLRLDPNEAEGHKALGLAFTAKGSYRPALRAYMEALRHDPNHASATANVGVMLMRFGSLDESLLWTRRTLEVSPNHSLVRANLAWNYLALEEWTLAESQAREIAADAPEIAHGHEALALLSAVRGAPQEGLALAEEIVRMDPGAPSRWQFAAELALMAREWEKAESYSREAMALTPGGSIPPFHFPGTTLAYTLLRAQETEEAMGYLSQVKDTIRSLVEAGGDDPRLAWEMGCLLVLEGRVEEGLEWLQQGYEEGWRWARVVELDPVLDDLRANLRFRDLLSEMTASVARMRQGARESEEAAGLR